MAEADVSISVIPSSVQRVAAMLGGTSEYLTQFVRSLLFNEAALTARAAIKFTPPIPYGGGWGDTKDAERQGKKAVDRDVRSFLMPKTATMASAIQGFSMESFLAWKSAPRSGWAKRSKTSIAYKIYMDPDVNRAFGKAKNISGKKFSSGGHELKDTSAIRAVHDGLRQRYKGRITQRGGPGIAIKAAPYYADARQIDDYVKTRQKMVGKVSSFWWGIILSVPPIPIRGADRNAGRTGVPAWIKRHSNRGLFIDRSAGVSSRNASVTIVNPIGDIFGIAREAKTKEQVIRFRNVANAAKPWDRILRNALLVANRGGRPT